MINYEKLLNKTVVDIKPSGIRRFFDIAEEMEEVISLGVGEPDFHTPWSVRETAINSLQKGNTRYTANSGILKLREKICDYTYRKIGVKYDYKSEVLVTVGGSEAIDLTIRALVEKGDEVIIPQPSFVCYEPITALAGGVAKFINTKQENNFRLTAEELKSAITDKTKILVLPYPCNPTGAVMRKQDLEEIAEVLKGTDIIVLTDEIYSELTYGKEKHVSISSLGGMRERTVVINGFSKSFSMTGWRLGYALGPKEIIKQMTKIHQYAIMSAPTTSQYAAITALTECDDDVEEMLKEYDSRRRLMVDGFNKLGLTCFEPEGAFYAFPCIKATGMKSEEFCEKLLYSQHVALVPGTAFGESGEGYLRASYCYSVNHIKEALKRIEKFLKEQG